MKIIRLFNELISRKNNNSKLIFGKNDSNNKIDRYSIDNDNVKYTKKSKNGLSLENYLN